MYKLTQCGMGLIIFAFFSGVVLAQNFTYQPPPRGKAAGNLLPVLSPQDYRKAVSAASQQNQNEVTGQVSSTLAKIPRVPPPPKGNPAIQATPNNTQTAQPAQTEMSSSPSNSAPPPEQDARIVSPIQSSPGSAPTYSNTPAAVTQPTQQQSQVYTGFQAAPAQKTPAQQQPASGGWNIRY